MDDRAHRWDNEFSNVNRDPFDSPYDDARYYDYRKPRIELRKGNVHYSNPNYLKWMGRFGKVLRGGSIFGEAASQLFPSEEAELIEDLRVKMDKQNKWLTGQEDIPKYDEGGEVDQRQLILNRANEVSTNYSDAKDFTLDPVNYAIRKLAKTLFGRGGISNCTLSATRWVDPNNQYMSAKNIFNNPDSGYTEISKDYVLPGDLLITKVPNKDSYHTMLVEGFNGDEPILRYSKGGHDTENNLVTGRTLSLYHKLDKEQGGNHDEDHYFRYNLPNEYWLPEITVTPKK